MMRRLIYYIVMLLVAACESPADITLHSTTTPIMTAFIYPDSDVEVNLYSSVAYTDTIPYLPLGNAASIQIEVDDIVYTADIPEGGITANFGRIDISEGANISVSTVDTTISASTSLLTPIEIEKFYQISVDYSDSLINFAIDFHDDASAENWYQLRVFDGQGNPLECDYNDYLFSQIYRSISSTPAGSQLGGYGLFDDELINGRGHTLYFAVHGADIIRQMEEGGEPMVEVRLYNHTYDYYMYRLTSLLSQRELLLPLIGMSEIYSNISNGKGIVSTMSFSSARLSITP